MTNNPFHRRDYQADYLRMESHVDFSSPHSLQVPGCRCFGYSDSQVASGGQIKFEGYVASRWTLEYIQEGKGRLFSDGATYLVNAGAVVLRNPRLGLGTADTMIPEPEQFLFKRSLMIAREPVLEHLFGMANIAPVEIVRLRDPLRFESLLDQVRTIVKTGHPYIHEELSTLVYACLLEVNKNRVLHDQMDDFSRVVYALTTTPQHYKNVNQIAQEFQMTRSALFRLFKRHFNTTPMDYIIKCRIENSCWYLANHSTSIRVIAQACGYDNPAFFSRTFKKIVGISPSEFRRQRSTQHLVRAPNPRRYEN